MNVDKFVDQIVLKINSLKNVKIVLRIVVDVAHLLIACNVIMDIISTKYQLVYFNVFRLALKNTMFRTKYVLLVCKTVKYALPI